MLFNGKGKEHNIIPYQKTEAKPFTIMKIPKPTIVTINTQSNANLNLEYVFKSTSQQK